MYYIKRWVNLKPTKEASEFEVFLAVSTKIVFICVTVLDREGER